eukprot:2535373-Pyramimonas_sp.AAC.1
MATIWTNGCCLFLFLPRETQCNMNGDMRDGGSAVDERRGNIRRTGWASTMLRTWLATRFFA